MPVSSLRQSNQFSSDSLLATVYKFRQLQEIQKQLLESKQKTRMVRERRWNPWGDRTNRIKNDELKNRYFVLALNSPSVSFFTSILECLRVVVDPLFLTVLTLFLHFPFCFSQFMFSHIFIFFSSLSFCPLISSGLCTHTFKAPGAKSNTHLTAQTYTHRFLSQHPRKLKTCAASVCVCVCVSVWCVSAALFGWR